MVVRNLNSRIFQYLSASGAKRCESLNELAKTPGAAFLAIMEFRGPYPESLHPRDVHDTHLVELLAELLRRCPRLFNEQHTGTLDPLRRHQLFSAAILTQDSQFTDRILQGLRDRSIYIKMLVADGIRRDEYLRTSGARRELERLLTVRSFAASEYDRKWIEAALASWDAEDSPTD